MKYQPKFPDLYELWKSHDLAKCRRPSFYQYLHPDDELVVWQFIEEHYLERYSFMLGLRFEWGSDGLWAIRFPGSVRCGGHCDIDRFGFPPDIVEAVFAWHEPLDDRPIESLGPNKVDPFDYEASNQLGLVAAKRIKQHLGDSVYVEFRPFQEIKIIEGVAVEIPIPSFIITVSHWDYAIEQAVAGNFEEITRLVNMGFDFNLIHPRTQEVWLDDYFSCVYDDDNLIFRCAMLKHVLALGCDPNVMTEDTCALTIPMWKQDEDILKILLEAGADPNKPSGFSPEESFYDWAIFDYWFNQWGSSGDSMSLDASEEDRATPDGLLDFYERVAKADGKKAPTHLRVLRAFGAKTKEELTQENDHD
jgi:hypothetical protein